MLIINDLCISSSDTISIEEVLSHKDAVLGGNILDFVNSWKGHTLKLKYDLFRLRKQFDERYVQGDLEPDGLVPFYQINESAILNYKTITNEINSQSKNGVSYIASEVRRLTLNRTVEISETGLVYVSSFAHIYDIKKVFLTGMFPSQTKFYSYGDVEIVVLKQGINDYNA